MYRQRGRPPGHWWRLAGVQLYSARAGLAVPVYSVQRVYRTAEARRRLSGTSHIGQSRRRGAGTRVMSRCGGERAVTFGEHDADITSENKRR